MRRLTRLRQRLGVRASNTEGAVMGGGEGEGEGGNAGFASRAASDIEQEEDGLCGWRTRLIEMGTERGVRKMTILPRDNEVGGLGGGGGYELYESLFGVGAEVHEGERREDANGNGMRRQGVDEVRRDGGGSVSNDMAGAVPAFRLDEDLDALVSR
jgi:hypothetical protein